MILLLLKITTASLLELRNHQTIVEMDESNTSAVFKSNSKRGRSEVDDQVDDMDAPDASIIDILKGLSSKMDLLTGTVAGNSVAINNTDTRLTQQIGKLEHSLSESVKANRDTNFRSGEGCQATYQQFSYEDQIIIRFNCQGQCRQRLKIG